MHYCAVIKWLIWSAFVVLATLATCRAFKASAGQAMPFEGCFVGFISAATLTALAVLMFYV